MAANPIFLDEAIEELVDAVIFYETEAPPGTAQRLAFEANAIIQRVIEAPRRRPIEANGYRRWRLATRLTVPFWGKATLEERPPRSLTPFAVACT